MAIMPYIAPTTLYGAFRVLNDTSNYCEIFGRVRELDVASPRDAYLNDLVCHECNEMMVDLICRLHSSGNDLFITPKVLCRDMVRFGWQSMIILK